MPFLDPFLEVGMGISEDTGKVAHKWDTGKVALRRGGT